VSLSDSSVKHRIGFCSVSRAPGRAYEQGLRAAGAARTAALRAIQQVHICSPHNNHTTTTTHHYHYHPWFSHTTTTPLPPHITEETIMLKGMLKPNLQHLTRSRSRSIAVQANANGKSVLITGGNTGQLGVSG
jgi:hypothetical protein